MEVVSDNCLLITEMPFVCLPIYPLAGINIFSGVAHNIVIGRVVFQKWASHMDWGKIFIESGLWSINQARVSQPVIGFHKYMVIRFVCYLLQGIIRKRVNIEAVIHLKRNIITAAR